MSGTKLEARPAQPHSLASDRLAEAIVQTIDQPLLLLSNELIVEEANSAFYELFMVNPEETVGRPLYDLGNGQWNIAELRELLEEVLPKRTVVEHYRIEHKFPDLGHRIMIVNARRLPSEGDRPETILLVISDRTEIEQARFELEGHVEFGEKLIDSMREALLVLDWDLNVVRANQPFYDTFRVSPDDTKGRPIHDLGNGQWNIPRLRVLLEDVLPDDNRFDDVEVEHEFESIGYRVMLLNGRRLDHLDLILLAIRDVTEQRRMEKERETRMGELHHRIKNVLTSVGALAKRTLRDSTSLDEFGRSFESRLGAMSRTQDLLMRAPDGNVGMTEILRLELQAHGGREGASFELNGPGVVLPQTAVQVFAMAIHELATNGIKHGALASEEGRVEVSWELRHAEEGETRVSLCWRERCPIDTGPQRAGYGSRVLESAFRHSLNGNSRLTLHPDGAEFVANFQV